MPILISTLAAPMIFHEVDKQTNAISKKKVRIDSMANIVLMTEDNGTVCRNYWKKEITDEDVSFLEQNYHYKKLKGEGFLKIVQNKKDIKAAWEGMEKVCHSAQLTNKTLDRSYEKSLQKQLGRRGTIMESINISSRQNSIL